MKTSTTRKAASKAHDAAVKLDHHNHNSSNAAANQQMDEHHDEDDAIARGGVATPFPWKLHEMLEDAASEGNEHIVSWQTHGHSFIVHKPKLFVEKIMPTYFNQSKFASFQRQLNLYGFSRLTAGRDKGAYYHDCFVRGERALCRNMVRQKIKGTKVRRTLGPEEEPDFYAMAAKAKKAKSSSTAVSTTSSNKNNKTTAQQEQMPPLTGKERAIKEHQERMNTVRDVLKQTEDLCNFDASDFDQFMPLQMPKLHFDGQDPSAVAAAPVISPIDSVASAAGDEDDDEEQQGADAGRSSMANLPWAIGGHHVPLSISLPSAVMKTPASFFDQPLARRVSVATAFEANPIMPSMPSSSTLSQLQHEITNGEVLFFEGKPFHYLEHMESLPPAPPKAGFVFNNNNKTSTKDNAQYQNYQPRDTLQSLMRVDPQSVISGYQRFSV